MDLKQLQQFVVLAEMLNFRRAAERLNIAQPALSLSLQRLEHELGVRLLDRSRHRVSITEAGAAALPEARRTLEFANRLKHQAKAGALGHVGSVRLGFVGTAAYDILPRALIAFRNQYPQIDTELRERTTADLLAELARGELDIGIVRYPTEIPGDALMETLAADTSVVALPPGHPLERREKVTLGDLAREPFIFPSSTLTPSLFHANMARCQMAGFSPRIVQEASQIQTIIGLVQGGVGVALLPALIARHSVQRIAFRYLIESSTLLPTGLALLHFPKRISAPALHFRHVVLEVAGVLPPA
ncbi:LysR family transcriptional regulator [uncultured Sphingomonas sp.]|uniref:LysR family transcriptional regulator n=1 Tax=uncultured Sphingomonas sp. TaxID=158754 RepID=UPI0035CB331F